MKQFVALFKEPEGLIYYGLTVIYLMTAYVMGLAGLFAEFWLIKLGATLLLAHGMVIAAYMIHEFAHNNVFRNNRLNDRFGKLMTWLCGAAYSTYEDIRYKHVRHHVENADPVWFDYQTFFNRHPLLLRTVKGLEWLYIPAHDLVMHALMMVSAFIIPQRRDQRWRNVMVFVLRGGAFLMLAYFSPLAALLYIVAYLIMMHILRFMDLVQHDYMPTLGLLSTESYDHKGDKMYEQAHTFSNPHTLKADWVNWLTLNFGFHNAHHTKPTLPWYRLPELHRQLYGEDPRVVIPLSAQLKIYHRQRVVRVMHEGAPDVKGNDYLHAAQQGLVYGGNAVSFLTAF